ncbi:hypothetical protein AB0O34_05020 [Sphaerisporangium sp. NPDC088356]|uniref:hypothetical protein n=1 Tax=Sphaerisporangium sp. NPDC088356 TaxID=3154871 RepID=UPI00344288B3
MRTGRLPHEGTAEPSRYEQWVRAGLSRLRADFPDHGFLVIGHGWYALRGRGTIIVSSGPDELRRALASSRHFG